jgi:hypothetical protein
MIQLKLITTEADSIPANPKFLSGELTTATESTGTKKRR